MGVKGALFQSGAQASQHWLPGAYSRLDFVRGSGGSVSTNRAVIAGDSRGGKPNFLYFFGSAAEAQETLRDGPLLDAVMHAFTPGGGLVPQSIGAFRVNPGTQATDILLESANNIITLTSADYGLHTNQVKYKLEAGTVSGKKVTIAFQSQPLEIFDDLYKGSLQIQYTGAGSAATMTTNLTQLVTAVTGGPGGQDLTLTYAAFPTIDDMVNYINDIADYTCTLVTGSGAKGTDPSSQVDSVTTQDIKTSAYTLQSTVQAIIDGINDSAWMDAVIHASVTTRAIPDNVATYTYLSGAVDGAYTSTEWGVSLTALEVEDVQFIGSSSEDAAIHALIKTHVEAMNAVTGKSERQFILGGAAGETVAQAVTRAQNLTSDDGMLAYPGFKHYDFDDLSVSKTWSPAYFAAKLLGFQVALALPEPATNKTVNVLNWESLLSIADAETCIKAGVCPGIRTQNGRYVVGRTVTTYQGSELQQVEFSMMRMALFISRDLRTELEEAFIGHAMNNGILGRVDAIVQSKLSQYNDLSVFSADEGVAPYWGYQKTVTGDLIKVEYNAYLTPPTNFIFVTSHLHVFATLPTS